MLRTMLCVLATVAASPALIPEKGDEIVQISFEDPEEQENRSPGLHLVEGYVDPIAGVAVLSFPSPCGNIQFELENLDDYSYLSGSIAGTGTAMIPFSCSTGHWRLTLTLMGGDEYVGEFTI